MGEFGQGVVFGLGLVLFTVGALIQGVIAVSAFSEDGGLGALASLLIVGTQACVFGGLYMMGAFR